MSEVSQIGVTEEEDGVRLDRWFKRRYPMLTHGRLEKLLRTGQVRVDGARVKANARLGAGQVVRIPPLGEETAKPAPKPERAVSAADAEEIRACVIHKDKSVLVLNKPAGLAVQGGTKTERHLDGMLDALTFEAKERPRLVHRLDRDTSGVLVLARTAKAAAALAKAFKQKGCAQDLLGARGRCAGPASGHDQSRADEAGRSPVPSVFLRRRRAMRARAIAATHFSTVATAAHKLAWVAFMPLTGRTHQIRVHASAIETPIVGDGKYGGVNAHPGGEIPRKLHLHARSLDIAHPDGGRLFLEAELPPHMKTSWKLLGFDERDAKDAFAGLEE
ncbi:pseudouridine synthase [Parvibaculum sp.]|uniref:pseudouridine synthase n=1 Tax=Parvibaculum sp. TaxID=2024848 RepID=UPI003BAD4875